MSETTVAEAAPLPAPLRALCRKLARVPFAAGCGEGALERFGGGAPRFCVRFKTPAAAWRALLRPDPGFGDAYMAGDVEIDDLAALLRAYHSWPRDGRLWPALRLLAGAPRRSASPRAQRAQVQSHYDRGNDFFSLWLDVSRTYSCAYFREPGFSLEQAQSAKLDHVLAKAQLEPGHRLLDIGSGWGALVLRAASRGALASGVTLSRRQLEHSRSAIAAAGLTERAEVALADYRDLPRSGRRFDRVVSVGMLEHVGRRNLPRFLRSVRDVLEPGGVCVLHAIMRPREAPIGAWIDKHIFPGGYIPSWREVINLLPSFGFHLIDDESLRRHYALTLEHWLTRFEASLDAVRALGFDEPFIRMWRFYLAGAASGFHAGALDLHQLVFTSGVNNQLAWTREPMYAPGPATPNARPA